MKDIEIGINQGFGYELSFGRYRVNRKIASCKKETNQEVNVLLLNHFGDRIGFSVPKEAFKSMMRFFAKMSMSSLRLRQFALMTQSVSVQKA